MKAKDLTVGMKVFISKYTNWENNAYGYEARIVSDKFGYWVYDRTANEYKMLDHATPRTSRGVLVECANGQYTTRRIIPLAHIRGEYTNIKARMDANRAAKQEQQESAQKMRMAADARREVLRQEAANELNLAVDVMAGQVRVSEDKFRAMVAELKRHGWKYTV